MGGQSSSTPQSGLSGLFLSNQPTQTGQSGTLAPITAPQSLIGQLDMSQIPAIPQPVAAPAPVTPQPAKPTGFHAIGSNTNMGQGGDNWGGLMVMPTTSTPPSPGPFQSAPQPAQQPYQPSRASLIAQMINSQFGKK